MRRAKNSLIAMTLCTMVATALSVHPASGADATGLTLHQVDPPTAVDNGIFQVQVDGGATLGALSITTGANHPAGPDLPVLSQPGRPGSSFFTVHSYDTGTDYAQREVAGAVNLAPTGAVTPLGATGVRVTYDVTDPDRLRIVQDVTISGKTRADSVVVVKTKIVNTGDHEARVGVRRLWDLHLLTDARPFMSLGTSPAGSDRSTEQSIPRPGGDSWYVHDPFHGLAMAGSIARGPSGSPTASQPDLIQYVNRSSVRDARFRYAAATPPRAVVGDSVLLAFWGDTASRARRVAPGGHVTLTTLLYDKIPPPGGGGPRGRPLPIRRRHRSVAADLAEQAAVASAPTLSTVDAAGDAPYGGGDIVAWHAGVVPGTGGGPFLRIRARTAEGIDPVWSHPWRFGSQTSVQAHLDVDGRGADYNIRLWDLQGWATGPGTGLRAEVFGSGASEPVCSGRPFHDGDATYGFDVPLSCLDNPATVRAWVASSFQPEPFLRNPPTGLDFSPDAGWSSPIAASG